MSVPPPAYGKQNSRKCAFGFVLGPANQSDVSEGDFIATTMWLYLKVMTRVVISHGSTAAALPLRHELNSSK